MGGRELEEKTRGSVTVFGDSATLARERGARLGLLNDNATDHTLGGHGRFQENLAGPQGTASERFLSTIVGRR